MDFLFFQMFNLIIQFTDLKLFIQEVIKDEQ